MDTRPVTAEELEAFQLVFRKTLGFSPPTEAELDRDKRHWDLSRSLAVFDGAQIVATAHSHLFEVSLPGGTDVPAAGVTAVATLTTHRRRGLLSSLMRRQLTEARDRGEPVALLVASEGGIYRRFGYGPSSFNLSIEVDPRDTLGMATADGAGSVHIADVGFDDDLLVGIHERARSARPGWIRRPSGWWEAIATDAKPGEQTHAFHTPPGSSDPDGYVRYQISSKWESGIPQHRINLHELVGSTPASESALWRHLLSADLVRSISVWSRPVDEPLRWWVANPRAVRVTGVSDYLWARPLDVEKLLTLRRYSSEIETVIEVVDELLPEAGGVFRLSGGREGAECARTERLPSISLGASDLGAVLFGGVSPAELAAAGRITEHVPGAVASAEAAFPWSPRPWGPMYF